MPKLSVRLIRVSLGYLLVGFSLGAMMLAHKGLGIHPEVMGWLPLHVELLLVGWTIQLVMGVAYWMLPRFTPERTGMNIRGYRWPAEAAFAGVNVGVLLVVLEHVIGFGGVALVGGRLFEVGGVACFLGNVWPRVKPVSSP